MSEPYKEILKFYSEQNRGLTEMSGQGQLPKSAQKTQETVNKIIQKYMNEMSKTLLQLQPLRANSRTDVSQRQHLQKW